jgi:hypothetical protein
MGTEKHPLALVPRGQWFTAFYLEKLGKQGVCIYVR